MTQLSRELRFHVDAVRRHLARLSDLVGLHGDGLSVLEQGLLAADLDRIQSMADRHNHTLQAVAARAEG